MGEQAAPGFGGLLRELRAGAGLTQEELAEAARLSPRSVSDLGQRHASDYPGAARAHTEALAICRDLGDRLGQADALYYLGGARRRTGDYIPEPEALNEKGTLHRVSGDLAQANGCHQQALEQARAIASPSAEAHALAGLGRCALAAGHTDEAADMLRNALEIFQRIGAAEAADVSAELDAATKAMPTAPGSSLRRR